VDHAQATEMLTDLEVVVAGQRRCPAKTLGAHVPQIDQDVAKPSAHRLFLLWLANPNLVLKEFATQPWPGSAAADLIEPGTFLAHTEGDRTASSPAKSTHQQTLPHRVAAFRSCQPPVDSAWQKPSQPIPADYHDLAL